MEDSQKNRLRTYAWSYFAYHADQRMKTFHFYLIVTSALTAGIITLESKSVDQLGRTPSFLCFGVAFLSLMFGFLDRRNARLVKNGEAALRHLDSLENHERTGSVPHVLEIFAIDDHTAQLNSRDHYSYSKILRGIFWVFGVAGVLAGMHLWK